MTRRQFEVYLEHVLDRTKKVLGNKGDEYSYNNGAFENFEEGVGLGFSITREAVAWGYAVKHLQAVKAMITQIEKGNEVQLTNTLVEEKFGDVINYMILIEAMLKERIENENQLEIWNQAMQSK